MVRRSLVFPAVLIAAVALSGCGDPRQIAEFARSAAHTARLGPPVFRDLADACDARFRFNTRVRAAWDKLSPPDTEPETCARFRAESEGLRSDSDALEDYFEAVRRLANTGSAASSGKDGSKSGTGGKSGGGSSPSLTGKRIGAASDLAQLVGQLAAERYRQSHLMRILTQADPDIAALTTALEQTVATQYGQELKEERGDAEDAYFAFGKTDARSNPALLFLLNRAYGADMAGMRERQHAADIYVAGLQKVRAAHHQLTTDAGEHNFKKLFAEAYDYGGQLENLAEDVKAAR